MEFFIKPHKHPASGLCQLCSMVRVSSPVFWTRHEFSLLLATPAQMPVPTAVRYFRHEHHRSPAPVVTYACSDLRDAVDCLQVYVMGPITIMVRRPSLALPIDPADVLERRGSITTVARVSAYHSETWRGDALGDPPQWAVQV